MPDQAKLQPVEHRPSAIVPGNHQLARLPPRDLALLAPHFDRVTLAKGQVLHEPGDLMPYVHLPELGTVLGLFAPAMGGRAVKVACVDRASALGLIEAADGGCAPTRVSVMLPGPSLRIDTRAFAAAARRSEAVRGMVRRTARMLMADMACNAACNALHTAEQRVARWLLAAHDAAQGDAPAEPNTDARLPMTQDELSDMLGVQRTTVTVLAKRLQSAGLVSYTRGKLQVCDRAGLAALACRCSEAVAQAHRRLKP